MCISPYRTKMYFNGIVITSFNNEDENQTTYTGFDDSRLWPLRFVDFSSDLNDLSERVEAHIDQKIFSNKLNTSSQSQEYTIAALTDMKLLSEYVGVCDRNQISIRIFLCATERTAPSLDKSLIEEIQKNSFFLGYDYAYSSCSYSAIHDDLYNPATEQLQRCKDTLNTLGLFNTETDVDKYINARWNYIAHEGEKFIEFNGNRTRVTPLEDSGDFVKFILHEINKEYIL